MQRARTSGSDRDAAVRRVAIVLSTLPPTTVAQLLAKFDPPTRRQMQLAMQTLVDVDPLERQRALQAFKGSLIQTPGASLDHSPGEPINPPPLRPEAAHRVSNDQAAGSRIVPAPDDPSGCDAESKTTPLSFLADVEDDTLVGMLSGEHPQAIALVLASIAPSQAARILPRLNASLQGDALSRIGRLGEIPQEAVNELATHLRERIKVAETVNRNEAGQRALGAILAAMPNSFGSPLSNEPTTAPREPLPTDNHSFHRHDNQTAVSGQSAGDQATVFAASPNDLSAVDQTHRLRLVRDLWPDDDTSPHEQGYDIGSAAETVANSKLAILESTDSIHHHLVCLSPEELCEALGGVTTRQAILSLCGLPRQTADAVLAILPRGQAKQVRKGMASLQSLQLREIDQAKEQVARVSLDLAAERTGQSGLAGPRGHSDKRNHNGRRDPGGESSQAAARRDAHPLAA